MIFLAGLCILIYGGMMMKVLTQDWLNPNFDPQELQEHLKTALGMLMMGGGCLLFAKTRSIKEIIKVVRETDENRKMRIELKNITKKINQLEKGGFKKQ